MKKVHKADWIDDLVFPLCIKPNWPYKVSNVWKKVTCKRCKKFKTTGL